MEKICTICHESKSLQEFTKNARYADGLEHKCRPCLKHIRNTYRSKNKQRYNAWKAQWKKAHPENVKQHYRNYYDNLSSEAKLQRVQYGRTYRQQHRDHINEITRQWRKARVLFMRLYFKRYLQDAARRAKHYKRTSRFNAIRRARKAAAPVVEAVDLDVIYARDRGICSLCHLHVIRADASRDHIIPLSKGGEHSYRNVVLAHSSCNASKKDRIVTQQMRLF